MAKTFQFDAADRLTVSEPGEKPGEETRWSLAPDQAAKHDAQFRADMTPAQRARLDQVRDALAPK